MNDITVVWTAFVVCLVVIAIAGSRLSRYGNIIAEKTGMGGTWTGLLLLATVTSLPELVSGISAVSLANAPNIAVGDVLGSCVFNLAVLFVLDLLHRGDPVYTRASQGHILSAGFGIIMLSAVAFNIMLSREHFIPSFLHVGAYTPIFVIIYALAMRTVFDYEKRQRDDYVGERTDQFPHVTLKQATRGYALAASFVVAAGLSLPFLGTKIAAMMGWSTTFVGTLLIAMVTSVPEVVVTVAALRIGAIDMAISNLFGSNVFNIFILALDDVFYLPGPLLEHTSSLHAVTAVSAILMTGIAIVGLFYRPHERLYRTVTWASLFLLLTYLLNSFVLYLHGD